MTDTQQENWRPMKSAPKDGTRIIVVTAQGEQGGPDIDVVRWGRGKARADECWMSTESMHDCQISYEDWEVKFWMPLPSTMPKGRRPGLAAGLPPIPKDGEEAGGSGI